MEPKLKSKINPKVDLDYLLTESEGQYLDRKSARIKPSDLARHFSAFSNAEGGVLVIGMSDKNEIEGINFVGDDKINEFLAAPIINTKPLMNYKPEFLDVINNKNEKDRILLYHIFPSYDHTIRTSNDSTYLRNGDKSIELKGDSLIELEYSKSSRFFEDEVNYNATIDDLDKELLSQYKEILNATNLTDEEILKARGLMKRVDGTYYLTNAAILLFAQNILQFYPNCRIRVLRYDGDKAEVGSNLNLVKDTTIEEPILKLIKKTIDFISPQLREFTILDPETVKFKSLPEYPNFAWTEGIVNAVAHRSYSLQGNYIKVSIYDDRLEIESPGKLPNIVSIDNIRETRYSTNPKIARVLTEFEWVRELNEGVKRIFQEMETSFLNEPIYREPNNSVRLTLENNIAIRKARETLGLQWLENNDEWNQLDEVEKQILACLFNRGPMKRSQLEKHINKSGKTISNRINYLLDKGLIKGTGKLYSPTRTYDIKI